MSFRVKAWLVRGRGRLGNLQGVWKNVRLCMETTNLCVCLCSLSLSLYPCVPVSVCLCPILEFDFSPMTLEKKHR